MLRLAICDDEQEQIELLREFLVRAMFRLNMDMDIAAYSSGAALLDAVSSGNGADIYFLDIKLADANGIDVAKGIREKDRRALIIFVTGRLDYILKGYEARAFRYIVKPATQAMIEEVTIQAIREIQLVENNCICFRENGEEVRVDIGDILYFEAQNHKIRLACSNTTHHFYGRIGEIEKRLADKGFVRCQKGYLINAFRIRRIGRSQVHLDNGRVLPVSSNYLRRTKDQFLAALR